MGYLRELAVLTYIATVALSSAATKTTCFAPPAYLGERGSLTCYFPVDVTAAKFSFNVRRTDRHDFDYKRDTVLDCDWIDGEQKCVIIKDGFTYDYHVSNRLTMIIPNVTLEHQGEYTCQVFKEATSNIQSCNLTVSVRESSPRASDGVIFGATQTTLPTTLETPLEDKQVQTAELNIVAIVVPVVIGAVIVAIVIVVYVVKRRNVHNSNSTSSKDGVEEKMLGSPTAEDETPPIVTSHLEGQNSASDVECTNESPPRSSTSGVRDDYVKVHKINEEATTPVGDEESGTQCQERQPLTGDPCVTSPSSTSWVDNEEEAADKDSANGNDATEENGDDDGSEHRDDEDDARYNDESKWGTSSDDEEKEDEEGPGASKKALKKKYNPVVKEMNHHNKEGKDILHPVPDQYKRKSAQRDLHNRIKPFTGKKK